MNRPSFQFYTKDWRSNSKLRRCSPAARGVWVDILCALHDSDEYGVARYTLKELANEVGASMAHVRELVDKGVLKGGDKELAEAYIFVPRSGRKDGDPVTLMAAQPGPVWFSSRMVRDEYVRTVRGESTRFGAGNGDAPKPTPNDSPKPSPKPPFGDGSSTASASAKKKTSPPVVPQGSAGGPLGDAAVDPDVVVGDHRPTRAGELCRLMKAEGIPNTNPGHPDLLALIAADVSDDEVRGVCAAALGKGNPFAYALAALTGQRQRAAAVVLHAGPLPATETPYQRAQRERMQAAVPSIAAKAPGTVNPNPMEVLDARIRTPR